MFVLKASNVDIINLKHDEVNGKIDLNNLKGTLCVSAIETYLLKHVEDASFVFKHRSKLIVDSRIAKEAIAKWGLIMHAGSSYKNLN